VLRAACVRHHTSFLGGVCFFLLFVDIAVFIFYFFSAHAVVVQVMAAQLAILLLA
jgi:hypothetical protein